MLKRAWADYEDDEELPPLPWSLIPVKPKPQAVKPVNNKFWLLDMEEDSDEEFDEDYCIGYDTESD
jgi:hypothetical protein